MESTVKERIKKFIAFKKISIREFERLCNLSNGYVKGIKHSILPEKMRGIILQYPELNIAWLVAGEGEMLKTETIAREEPAIYITSNWKDKYYTALEEINKLKGEIIELTNKICELEKKTATEVSGVQTALLKTGTQS